MALTPKPKTPPVIRVLKSAVFVGTVALAGCDSTVSFDGSGVTTIDAEAIPPMPPPQPDAGVPTLDGGAIPPMPPPQDAEPFVDGAIPPMPPPQDAEPMVDGPIPPMPPPMPNPTPEDS